MFKILKSQRPKTDAIILMGPFFSLAINTLRIGDENSRLWRFGLYICERHMTQICLLTRVWILHT
jgi:hypothetical protein